MSEVTLTASRWVFEGGVLELECVLTAFVSDIQVTLVDARTPEGNPVRYWQRAALIEWVACHQQTLRAVHAGEKKRFDWDSPGIDVLQDLPPGWNGLEPSGWTEVAA